MDIRIVAIIAVAYGASWVGSKAVDGVRKLDHKVVNAVRHRNKKPLPRFDPEQGDFVISDQKASR